MTGANAARIAACCGASLLMLSILVPFAVITYTAGAAVVAGINACKRKR